ncbi:oligosaccharide flippase family protein [Staphylococcus auricularis]
MKKYNQSAFDGVVVLTVALLIVKVLSAVYRVPYQNILGDAGLYAFQQVYPIVALSMILSMNAVPSAVTQLYSRSRDEVIYSKLLLRIQLVGIAVFIVLIFFAPQMAQLMGDEHLAPMLRSASFSFLFIGILGVLRGYFQSKNQMAIPAVSQVIEQVIRVAIIIVSILIFIQFDWSVYHVGALAIGGSAIGFLLSSVYIWRKKPFTISFKRHKQIEMQPWSKLVMAVMIFAVSQLIVILWQVVDSFTVLNGLRDAGISLSHAVTQKGVYDRGASFIQMGLIVTTTFSFVLIPLLTKALHDEDMERVDHYANVSVKITVAISTAACVGLINLLPLMNRVFFKEDTLTGTLAVYMLTVICVSLIMIYISLLQVRKQEGTILIALIIGMLTKALANMILVPAMHIMGASIATVVSLIIFVLILQLKISRLYHFSAMMQFVLKLIISMIVMTLSVQCILQLVDTEGRFTGFILLIVAAIIGMIVLGVMIVILHMFSDEELQYLPMGKKLSQLKKGRR